MEPLSFINSTLKYFAIVFIALLVVNKSLGIKNPPFHTIILSFLFSFLMGIFYAILINYLYNLLIIILILLFVTIYISITFKIDFSFSLIVSIVALLISFASYIVSVLLSIMFVALPIFNIEVQSSIIIFLCMLIQYFLVKRFFMIKRFSNGFSFLKEEDKLYNFTIVGLILGGTLILFFSIFRMNQNANERNFAMIAFALIILGSYIWIKRSITLDYRERMRNREVNMLKEELEAEKEKNVKLNEEISELAKINHKYSSRIKASEESVKKLAYMFNKTNNTEFGNELSDITKLITDLSSQYSNEIASKLKYAKKLPSTNVKGVDSILSYMQKESLDNNIDFELKINCSVNHLIEKYISQNRLETLLGDHIKDAIIAINSGNNNLRKIYVIFDIIDNCYQISFYDSGIDFEIDTLINLGIEAITTHKDTGGNGFGFLTTFETLKECKASLIIEEINFKNSNFSKAIHVLFDNNSSYVIKTNRIEDFKNYNISDRIILEEEKNN